MTMGAVGSYQNHSIFFYEKTQGLGQRQRDPLGRRCASTVTIVSCKRLCILQLVSSALIVSFQDPSRPSPANETTAHSLCCCARHFTNLRYFIWLVAHSDIFSSFHLDSALTFRTPTFLPERGPLSAAPTQHLNRRKFPYPIAKAVYFRHGPCTYIHTK